MADPATDTNQSQANPFAGQSLDQLVRMPDSLQDTLTSAAKEKATSDTAINEHMLRSMEQHAREADQYRNLEVQSFNDVKKWDAKAESQKYAYDPVEAFGSFSTIFAIAASAFTKAPMENALNGAAASMNAIKAGKQQDFDRAFTAFKENNELAIKRGQMMHEAYQDAIAAIGQDYTKGEALAKIAAIKYGDTQALAFINAGMSKEFTDLISSRAQAVEGMAKAHEAMIADNGLQFKVKAMTTDPNFYSSNPTERLNVYNKYFGPVETGEQTAVRKWVQEHPKASPEEAADKLSDIHRQFNTNGWMEDAYNRFNREYPDATAQQRADYMKQFQRSLTYGSTMNSPQLEALEKSNPELYKTLHDLAVRSLKGDHSADNTFSIRDPKRALFQEMKNKVGFDEMGLSPDQFAIANSQSGFLAAEARAQGASAGRMEIGAATVATEAPLAITASSKVPRGKFVPINQLSYMARRADSDPALQNLDQATQSLVLAYTRVGAGSATATDSLREHAYQILNQATSHETYKQAVEFLQKETQRMVAAPHAIRDALNKGLNVNEALAEVEKNIEKQTGGPSPGLGPAPPNNSTQRRTIIEVGKSGKKYQYKGPLPPTPESRAKKENWEPVGALDRDSVAAPEPDMTGMQ